MKKTFFRLVASLTLAASLCTVLPLSVSAYDNSVSVAVDGLDCSTDNGNVFVYPNESEDERVIKANEFGFRYTKLMVFNAEGRIIEAGGEIFENSETVTGSPQESVKVPAKGFLVAFKSSGAPELRKAYDTAMEGAMLYNATMSVIYPVYASYSSNTLTVEYDAPTPAGANAKTYLFVGNSSTYFNGTPIKFKALADAAGVEINVEYCTYGSAFLSEFADETHERGKAFRQKLTSNKYDYVVLQDGGSADYYDSKPAMEKIMPLIEKNGAEALLYMRYSSSKTPESRPAGAKVHHDNYTQLSEDYSLTNAPAADAFLLCYEKYPEIVLHADDNSHHSKEGSYLIACVWLKSYLGIDPRGNSYTAELPDNVASALQEIAVTACEEGYPFPEEKDTFTDKDGNTYDNIAIGKNYVPAGKIYEGDWTDTDENGTPLGKLTDGKYANEGGDRSIGCYSGDGHSITVDLESISSVRAIKTDLYGNESWGIIDPSKVEVSVSISNDGESFIDVGKAEMSEETASGDWKKRDFVLELGSPVNARYVRVTYNGGNFVWSSEVSVYGSVFGKDDISVEESEEESVPVSDYQEPEGKKYAWLYWVIGGVTLAGVIAAAILISKKYK